jgi:mono/diheme cytochrome c family protein
MRLVRVRSMKKIQPSTACAWFLCGALEISATFGLSSPALALADEASDAREGEALATKICSDCHVVSLKVGPPFAEIAKGSRAAPRPYATSFTPRTVTSAVPALCRTPRSPSGR